MAIQLLRLLVSRRKDAAMQDIVMCIFSWKIGEVKERGRMFLQKRKRRKLVTGLSFKVFLTSAQRARVPEHPAR